MFPLLDEGIKYDSYNENLLLYKHLGFSSTELTLDLADNSKKLNKTHYLLSVKKLNYKIIKTYALDYRPIELNVLMDNFGEGIYLYDTMITCKNKSNFNSVSLVCYRYCIHSLLALLKRVGIREIVELIFNRIIIHK